MMSWEAKFKRAFAAIHPNIKKLSEPFSPEEMDDVSRYAERCWQGCDPYAPKTLKEVVERAITAVDYERWEMANPEKAARIRRGEID